MSCLVCIMSCRFVVYNQNVLMFVFIYDFRMGGCVSSRSHEALETGNLQRPKSSSPRHQIHEAIKSCDGHQLARMLVSKTQPNVYDQWGMTPLHLACEMGDDRLVVILLAMGAHVDLPTPDDQGCCTPLLFAATHGRTECVRVLLRAGAAVDAPDIWGNTPLYKAACYNHHGCVRLLLEHGADHGGRLGGLDGPRGESKGAKVLREVVGN